MTPEVRDRLIDGIEDTFKAAGAQSYEQGLEVAIRLFEEFLRYAQMIRTREHVAALIDLLPDFPVGQEHMVAATAELMPQLMALNVGELLKMFLADFKLSSGGRPLALTHGRRIAVIKYISQLNLDGNSMAVCKRYASRHFKVSVRTIERVWQRRARILEGERKVSLQEAQEWLLNIVNQPADTKLLVQRTPDVL